ncbi:MAG: hypothetical protein U0R44_05890 [Candidatus Micrarchaeia archaeon]
MKGQLALEFLLLSALSAAVILLLCISLDGQIRAANLKAAEMADAQGAEDAARAAESSLNGALPLGSGTGGRRIENGILYFPEGGKLVEIRGVFVYDGSEPV